MLLRFARSNTIQSYIAVFNQGFFVDGALWVLNSTDGKTFVVRPGYTPSYSPHDSSMMGCPNIMSFNGQLWVSGSKGTDTTSWTGSTIEIAKSTNGGDAWTYVSSPNFPSIVAGGSAPQVWSEPWFIDNDGSVHIFLLACPDATTSPLQSYLYIVDVDMTTSPPTFGAPTLITGTGLPSTFINPAMVHIGSTYYLFFKNDVTGQKHIEVASSSSMKSGYTMFKTGDWAGWGAPMEAPMLINLDNGANNNWRIYLDPEGQGEKWSETTTGLFGTWSAPAACTAPAEMFSHKMQHGNVIEYPF